MRIRNAAAKDFIKLPDIETSAARAFIEAGFKDIAEMPSLPAAFYETLPNNAIVLVSEHKTDEICGFCVVIEIDGQAHLKELSVSYHHSGKGMGAALLNHAITEAQNKGYAAITLTTFADFPFNAPFYQRNGFQAFTPDIDWPELTNICEKEKDGELGNYERVSMIKQFQTS